MIGTPGLKRRNEGLRYLSTRGGGPQDFTNVLLDGLARDGGLFVPESWPQFSAQQLASFRGRPYHRVAAEVMRPFLAGAIPDARFDALIEKSYRTFRHPAVAPLVQLGPDDWALELFHGPTFAFKDFALQVLGRLFDEILGRLRRRVTIVGATSGDTGSAAIEACRGREAIDIFILHPEGRVSEVQRRQMTTVADANVHNIAIAGTFDDCQALVKAMFNDAAFRDRLQLSAVNSINWARVMAQIVYYVTAAVALGAPHREIAFSVPTGNFGDVFAGYAARAMGLPIRRLVVATNRNDILARFLDSGTYRSGAVVPTESPSMDIQVSSNFERLLFDLVGRSGAKVEAYMAALARHGEFSVEPEELALARTVFTGHRVGEEAARAAIAETFQATGWLADPHTAIGLAAAEATREPGVATVTLATAHPAKFGAAVARATGSEPPLPAALQSVMGKPERLVRLANDLARVEAHIAARARITQEA